MHSIPRGPNKYICYKLSKVMRKVQKYYEQKLEPYAITPVQFYVFNALWEQDGLKFKELAEAVNLDGSTLTGILDRMERAEFVERRDDPDDRRSLLIFLTEKAKKTGPEILRLAEGFDWDIQRHIPAEDFIIFQNVLDRLFTADI